MVIHIIGSNWINVYSLDIFSYWIMKYIKFLLKSLQWLLYLMVSGKDRQIYQHAKFKDRECLGVENDMFGSTYKMGKKLYGKEPTRNFITWKEFRKTHKF